MTVLREENKPKDKNENEESAKQFPDMFVESVPAKKDRWVKVEKKHW